MEDTKNNYLDYSDILKKNTKIVEEKGKQYGNTYHLFGTVMDALFPNGITILGIKEQERFGVFFMLVHKLIRISKKLFDNVSLDSLTDLSNYAAMLEKIIIEQRNKK